MFLLARGNESGCICKWNEGLSFRNTLTTAVLKDQQSMWFLLPACVRACACVRAWLPVAPLCWVLHDTATYFDYDNRDFISRMLGFSNKAFLRYTVAWKWMIIVTWCICVFKVLISSILVLSNTYEYEHNESVYQVSCSSGQNILRNSNSFHYCKGHCNWS